MPDKSNFTPDEWKLLLESVMMAGIAVSAAEPSGLWGLLKESFAEGSALMTAKLDPGADALIKAVVADFETAEGRRSAQAASRVRSKPSASRRCGRLAQWWMPRRPAMQQPSRAGCARSANTLPRHRRKADFLASAACA